MPELTTYPKAAAYFGGESYEVMGCLLVREGEAEKTNWDRTEGTKSGLPEMSDTSQEAPIKKSCDQAAQA